VPEILAPAAVCCFHDNSQRNHQSEETDKKTKKMKSITDFTFFVIFITMKKNEPKSFTNLKPIV